MPDPIPTTTDRSPFAFVPMTDGDDPAATLAALLKQPGSLIYQLHQARPGRLVGVLAVIAVVCLSLYGLAIGSFSGGTQWWAAPVKTVGGTFLSVLICLPSLYIFSCLGGGNIRLGPLCGVLLAVLGLNGLLLIGFAPVAWVFAQSTESVAFMGALHLGFWAVSMGFALRLVAAQGRFVDSDETGYLKLWFVVFFLVCLQMTTALRPFVGRSDTFLPTTKIFFLSHWGKCIGSESD